MLPKIGKKPLQLYDSYKPLKDNSMSLYDIDGIKNSGSGVQRKLHLLSIVRQQACAKGHGMMESIEANHKRNTTLPHKSGGGSGYASSKFAIKSHGDHKTIQHEHSKSLLRASESRFESNDPHSHNSEYQNLSSSSKAQLNNLGLLADNTKVVEIDQYLKQKIDVTRLNVRMFQAKIQRFQNKYGMNLVADPTVAQSPGQPYLSTQTIPKKLQNKGQLDTLKLHQQSEKTLETLDFEKREDSRNRGDAKSNIYTDTFELPAYSNDQLHQAYIEKIRSLKLAQTVSQVESKKKNMHQNGLEFYRVRSGINDLPKLKFTNPDNPAISIQ